MGGFIDMNSKKLIICTFLFVALVGLTLNSVSAEKVPTKYKIHSYTNHYYVSDSYYSDGKYIWESRDQNLNNPVIQEKYSGSKTRIQFYTYNNNGNRYHWMDVISSQLTVKYKIITNKKTYFSTKTVRYTKIPKYGMTKILVLKGPVHSQVLIYYMKWTQVNRVWYDWK